MFSCVASTLVDIASNNNNYYYYYYFNVVLSNIVPLLTLQKIMDGDISHIQDSVNEIQSWTRRNHAELNEEKCKELRIDFTRKVSSNNAFLPISINNKSIDIVDHAKVLGVILSNDLKWNKHIASVVSKASKRLHLIT